MSPYSSETSVNQVSRRAIGFMLVAFLFYAIILSRLFFLQIQKGSDYQAMSDQISVREEEIQSRRGLILDRYDKVLADNRPYLEITVIPQEMKDADKIIAQLTKLIPITEEQIRDALKKAKGAPPFLPVVIQQDAPYEWVSRILEHQALEEDDTAELKGVLVRSSPLRVFPYPELFSHVLGYLKEIDKTFIEKIKGSEHEENYSMGDMVGASGIETAYDLDLRGKDGIKARVVDAQGREIRNNEDIALLAERASSAPIDGYHLRTTLDYDAQKAAEEGMAGRKGAVVAMDPFSGEVIVMYSFPGYDANRIMKNIDKKYWQKINLDPDKYLYNRAIQAAYPPGSTYKMVGMFAGMDSGKVPPDKSFSCNGGMKFGNRVFHCWNKGGHGSMHAVTALMQSCDIYFYNVGLKLGVDGLHHYANLLGLGMKTGIEIPYEQSGLIPSTEWKMRRYKTDWIESETLSIAIGQGYDLVTPLQNARMAAMLANGGRPLTPHLGKAILDENRHVVREISYPLGEPVMKPEVLSVIQEGMKSVVHGAGTAGRLKASKYKIAGKTGTAQVTGYESKIQLKDHALFVSYAPYDDPKIAVSVIVENGGHGGSDAAPVAQKVIDAYLDKVMGNLQESKVISQK